MPAHASKLDTYTPGLHLTVSQTRVDCARRYLLVLIIKYAYITASNPEYLVFI